MDNSYPLESYHAKIAHLIDQIILHSKRDLYFCKESNKIWNQAKDKFFIFFVT